MHHVEALRGWVVKPTINRLGNARGKGGLFRRVFGSGSGRQACGDG